VKLEKANVVFDIGKLVLNGEMPFFIGDMDLLATDLKDWSVKGQVIAVFHGDAAYLVLNDDAYDANRHIQTRHPVKTGNPYAKLLTALMERGVQIELCGATAAANHWGNADLIPGVKVNTNAMASRSFMNNLREARDEVSVARPAVCGFHSLGVRGVCRAERRRNRQNSEPSLRRRDGRQAEDHSAIQRSDALRSGRPLAKPKRWG
jgi:intracellular sulfur oxidation DsrE/DsrF family protein